MVELILDMVKLGITYEIVFSILIALRFMTILICEMQNTVNAIQLRGVDMRKVYKRKVLIVYISFFSPIFIVFGRKLKNYLFWLSLEVSVRVLVGPIIERYA